MDDEAESGSERGTARLLAPPRPRRGRELVSGVKSGLSPAACAGIAVSFPFPSPPFEQDTANHRLFVYDVSQTHGNVSATRSDRDDRARGAAAPVLAVGRRRQFPGRARADLSEVETAHADLDDPLHGGALAETDVGAHRGAVDAHAPILDEFLGK